jgi:hypothetical protein
MIDALLVVIIVLVLKVLHNQARVANPETETFALWLIKASLAVGWIIFLVWAYARWIR